MSERIEVADRRDTRPVPLRGAREDRRPRIPEPPPVRLVAVDDVQLPAAAGCESLLDAFYVELLGFDRDASDEGYPVYRAANFRLCFVVAEPPVRREDLRALGIEVESLADAARKLVEARIDYLWQTGVSPGTRNVLLLDPAGNWIELTEATAVR